MGLAAEFASHPSFRVSLLHSLETVAQRDQADPRLPALLASLCLVPGVETHREAVVRVVVDTMVGWVARSVDRERDFRLARYTREILGRLGPILGGINPSGVRLLYRQVHFIVTLT